MSQKRTRAWHSCRGSGFSATLQRLPTVLSLFRTATEPLLRQGAARTMGMLGDHRATAPLVAALHEPSVSPGPPSSHSYSSGTAP